MEHADDHNHVRLYIEAVTETLYFPVALLLLLYVLCYSYLNIT